MEGVLQGLLLVFLAIFAVLFIFSVVILAVHHRTGGAMFVPTAGVMIRTLVDEVDFARFERIQELGAGDGRFLHAVERRYGVAVTGYEINPLAYLMSRARIAIFSLSSRVFWQDFWQADLKGTDCIYCYLFPDIMERLGAKLEDELDDGAVVISANFPLPGWRAERIVKASGTIFNDPIHIYRMGTHRDRTGGGASGGSLGG